MTREEAISLLHDMKDTYDEIHENTNYEIGYEQMTALDMAIEALSAEAVKRVDCSNFLLWLLDEIMDEENWELNAVADGEIIARKLKKLGLLEVKDGYYIRHIENNTKESDLVYRPSAEAVSREFYEDVVKANHGLAKENSNLKAQIESAKAEWIPCSERLPKDIKPVIVTWKNTDPKSYYQYIVGKHFIGTAHYKNGKWFWYSSVTEDLLAEYGRCDSEEFDEAIEVVAWMPLPKPYKGGDSE